MTFDPTRHRRRSIRLPRYDYAQPGAYFVTICTHRRLCLFGEVVGDAVRLNDAGEIVRDEWLRTSAVRPNVIVDAFVVMPNHVHGIIGIVDPDVEVISTVGATRRVAPTTVRPGPPSGSLGAIVGQIKSHATKRINRSRGTPGAKVWQRGYYERVLRDERELEIARRYVEQNPLRWHLDRMHPARLGDQPAPRIR